MAEKNLVSKVAFMNTLGIAIKITSNGAGDPIVINEGDWIRHVADVRPVLDMVNGADNDNRQVVRFLSFTDEGCLLTVARFISGRQGDNVAAWIFIPANIAITGKEVVYAMDMAEQAILASKLETAELEQICRQSYPTISDGYSKASCGEAMAYRFYTDSTLEDILRPHRYQSYYNKFRYIFLFEKNGTLGLANPAEATDLSKGGNEAQSVLIPPTAEELQQYFGYSVQLLLPDDTPFDRPVSLKKGYGIDLKLVREGFHPITYRHLNASDAIRQYFSPSFINPSLLKWQMPFLLSDVSVVNEEGTLISSDKDHKITVRVNNIVLKPGLTHWFEEKTAKNAIVEVTSNSMRYQPVKEKKDLTHKPVSITLPYRREQKMSTIITQNGDKARLEYQVAGIEKEEHSPIIGYYFNGHGELTYDVRRPWKHRLQGFLVAAMIALVALLTVYLLSQKQHGEKKQVNVETPDMRQSSSNTDEPVKVSEKQDLDNMQEQQSIEDARLNAMGMDTPSTYDQAIAYLDSNKVWKRSEMEQYQALQGLFDDMNEFNLRQITNKWSMELSGSATFQKIVSVADKNLRNGWNPVTGSHSPCYNKPNDEAISVINYIYWLDRDQTQPVKVPATTIPATNKQGTKTGKPATKPVKQEKKETKTPAKTSVGSGNKGVD